MNTKPLLLSFLCLNLGTVVAFADDLKPLDSDRETDRVEWSQLDQKFGPMPKPAATTKLGGVCKT